MSATLGRTVKDAIDRSDIEFRDLCRTLGLSKKSMHRRLCGEVPFLAYEIIMIANTLGISVRSLLADMESEMGWAA